MISRFALAIVAASICCTLPAAAEDVGIHVGPVGVGVGDHDYDRDRDHKTVIIKKDHDGDRETTVIKTERDND
jgi:fatty acid-binding protein DegV